MPVSETGAESVGRPAIVAGQPASGPTSLGITGEARVRGRDSARDGDWVFQDGQWVPVHTRNGGAGHG